MLVNRDLGGQRRVVLAEETAEGDLALAARLARLN
jgi:hypothetical protein